MLRGLLGRFRKPAVEAAPVQETVDRRNEARCSCKEVVQLQAPETVRWARLLDVSHRGLRVSMLAAGPLPGGSLVQVSCFSGSPLQGRQRVFYRVAWAAERDGEWEMGLSLDAAAMSSSQGWADHLLSSLWAFRAERPQGLSAGSSSTAGCERRTLSV